MKNRFLALISTLILLLVLSSCSMCSKNEDSSQIPKSLEGRVLKGVVTFGSGAFSEMEGYSFKISFLKGRGFTATNSQNEPDSQGDYTYTRVDENTGNLILTDHSTLHQGSQMEVKLKFTSPTTGTFDGRFVSGPSGEENGTFELN